MTRLPNFARPAWASTVATAALFGAAILAVTSCSGGPIAANDPLSSGNSFVSGSYSSQYFAPGSRLAAPAVSATTLTGQRFSLAAERLLLEIGAFQRGAIDMKRLRCSGL